MAQRLNRVQGQVVDDCVASLLVGGTEVGRGCSQETLDGDLEIEEDASLHSDHLVKELVSPLTLFVSGG